MKRSTSRRARFGVAIAVTLAAFITVILPAQVANAAAFKLHTITVIWKSDLLYDYPLDVATGQWAHEPSDLRNDLRLSYDMVHTDAGLKASISSHCGKGKGSCIIVKIADIGGNYGRYRTDKVVAYRKYMTINTHSSTGGIGEAGRHSRACAVIGRALGLSVQSGTSRSCMNGGFWGGLKPSRSDFVWLSKHYTNSSWSIMADRVRLPYQQQWALAA